MGPEMTGEGGSKLDEFQRQAAQTTNAAVAEGHNDVHVAKATGVGYLDQAKSIAGSVLSSAQGYLQGGEQHSQPQGGSQNGSGTGSAKVATAQGTTGDVLSKLQTGASSAIGTTQQYLSSAQAAAQPHIDNARTTVEPRISDAKAALQPHMDKAKETAQGYLGLGTGPTGSVTPPGANTAAGTGIPATSTPLEGKEGVAPRPTTTTVSGDKQADGKLKTSVA
ncbi:hypothetical protein SERLA73DRAFT_190046 [Serpula lacrymans var. lacrymans S7.3]|uniref:Uncharacterized protein n=1 Tax=Serpula lacrymans var. lacrymans (strain S7.3) TaxID=936435 RepID=F8QEZ8_SERL3|nr:hypothetical protein SERLA73DRAFT_190046 [Serpula lacrymans var. lacrymans S7.3]